MWNFRTERLDSDRGSRVCVELEDSPASFLTVLRHWREDRTFRASFNQLLADSKFTAFRWETPPITSTTAGRPFEFVLLDSPRLARPTEPEAFREHFSQANAEGIIEFANLGRDAILIVPSPQAPESVYGHLAAFVRHAPPPQIDALWKAVGEAMQRRLSAKPVWLSTAGAGVSWLHVRLDDRPKYYGHAPYRSE